MKRAHELFVKDKLLKRGAAFIATHFSPHHSPLHHEIEKFFGKENIIAAYDGMKIDV